MAGSWPPTSPPRCSRSAASAPLPPGSWGSPDRVPFLAVPLRIATQQLNVAPPPPGTPGPLSRPTPDALGGLLETAGFSEVEVEEAEVTFEWRSPEEFTTFIRETVPPVTAMIASHPQQVQDQTW